RDDREANIHAGSVADETLQHGEANAREDHTTGGVRRDRSLERFELRRHGESPSCEGFDREVQWDREHQRDRGREDDPHAAPMSACMASMTAACTSRASPRIGCPHLTVTLFARYAG